MKKLFAALTAGLSNGQGGVLCSITASSGSTPRGPGAKMLVLENGEVTGSIGGGAAEYQAIRLARRLLAERRSEFASYRMSPGEPPDSGMICGGEIRVYLQYIAPDRRDILPVLHAATELVSGAAAAWLVTLAAADGGWRMGVFDGENGLRFLSGVSREEVEPLLGSQAALSEKGGAALFVEPLNRAGTVYLFGGGHVGRQLTHILSLAGFRVVVWDERPEAAKKERLPDAAEVICRPYEGAAGHLPPITADDYVVVMTPGHQADDTVLAQVLRSPARYIGCIGSERKAAATRDRLLSAGFSEEEVGRIYAPIGLPVGGKTPGEIAVSVAAQMIACRWGRLDGEGLLCAAN